jgi:hypothetical protein
MSDKTLREINGDWLSIRKGGSNGFFIIILTLSWWLNAGAGVVDADPEFARALEDVSWVLDHLISSSKRVHDEEIDDRNAKRR